MVRKRKVVSYTLPIEIIQGLERKSHELSIKYEKRITKSDIIEKALLKFGVTPCKSPKKKSPTKE